MRPRRAGVGLQAADGDHDVVAVAEVDVGPVQAGDLAAAERAEEEQGDDRVVDQAAALGGLRALKAATGAARAEAGGEDGGALVGGQAAGLPAAARRVGPRPTRRNPSSACRVEVMADIVTSAVSAGSPVHQSGHRGRAAQDVAPFITHRAVERLKERLSDAFDRFLEGVADNRQVAFDDDGWRLKTDPAEQPDPAQSDRLAELHRWLDARGRTIRLADLLIEVENDLGFSVHFQQPGEKWVDPGEVCALLAAILAHGCNLGLYTMEKVAPDIAYRRLKYVSDWRLVEENQRAALAAIVHGISRLDAAGHWGDGTTSASDGQRFAMPHKVLQRTYSTRFNDFALEFYSFVADNYAPFYSRPIECTDRDAPFVLDGVLYHESDLNLEEHYTDTHGYTEINFAAFGMIGMRFCPRIRSLHRQRIYCADPARDHGVLEPVLQRGRRAVNFRLIAEQWDRIGQFYAAFPAGHATASAALQRLNRFQASNRFYAANRELGRALKTEFVLQYMSEPKLRAKVRRGLLKVEQLHALARALYYGQRGRISAREVYDQMNACSCLTLILACIVYWQAREISRLAAAPDFPFDPDLLRHVSPIEWKNVILYGEIKIDPAKLKMRRP